MVFGDIIQRRVFYISCSPVIVEKDGNLPCMSAVSVSGEPNKYSYILKNRFLNNIVRQHMSSCCINYYKTLGNGLKSGLRCAPSAV